MAATGPVDSILYRCPACSAKVQGRKGLEGKTVKCPKCSAAVKLLPVDEAAPAASTAPRKGNTSAIRKAAAPADPAAPARKGRTSAVLKAAPPAEAAASEPAKRGGTRVMNRGATGMRARGAALPRKKSRAVFVFGLIGVLAAGGAAAFFFLRGGSGGGSTPEAAFDTMKNAVASRDWGLLYECVAPSERRKGEQDWEKSRKEMADPKNQAGLAMAAVMLGVEKDRIPKLSFKEMFVAMMGNMSKAASGSELTKMRDATITGKKMEGTDRCSLTIKSGSKESSSHWVLEGGKWYATRMMGGMLGQE